MVVAPLDSVDYLFSADRDRQFKMIGIILILVLIALVTCLIYLWHKQKRKFFLDRKLPFVDSSVFGGSLKDVLLMRKSVAQVMLDLYEEAKVRNVACIGARFMHKNVLILRDTSLIKRILVQDFNSFSNRSAAADFHHDPLGGYNLFLLKNPEWHDMRKKITPVFTAARMRQFFEEIKGMGNKLNRRLLQNVAKEKVVALKDLNGAYCSDVYASCSFGIEVNFIENPQSVFGKIALEMFNFKAWRALEFGSNFFSPEISKVLKRFFFSKAGSSYLRTMLSSVLEERKAHNITRNDLMDVILKIKSSQEMDSEEVANNYSDDMLLAQSVIFFVAGFETTSTALSHAFYELAKNVSMSLFCFSYI